MYSLKELFKQEPASIVAVLAMGFAMAIGFDWLTMTDKQLSLVNAFALGLLTLIYIRPSTVSKDALQKVTDAVNNGPAPTPPVPDAPADVPADDNQPVDT